MLALLEPSLFGFPPSTDSLRDLTDEDAVNLAQAEHEWRLARDFGTTDRQAEWARRWAEALMSAIGGGEVERLRAQVARLEIEVDDYPDGTDTRRVEEPVEAADDLIADALHELGERPITAAAANQAVEHLNDARKELDRASRELEKL